ncbi:MAG: PTS sugar transporter subunit IIB [Myxococcaceae bacterium]|nr:PTS sugar transporter subunit IIB [Myxococcaceae bacterium]
MITLTRIDNRLIHGQVIEGWVPYLKISRVVVADDEAADNTLLRAAMRMAVPGEIDLRMEKVALVDYAALASDAARTLLLFRDVTTAMRARTSGWPTGPLNLGNLHAGLGRVPVTRSVFLDDADRAALKNLAAQGAQIQSQATPGEAAVTFA